MNYPISVVVPTKNRYKYLKKLIELVVSFNTQELEFVIQDNSDDNQEIMEFLNNYKYPWLRYFYCKEHLTSIENFDLAINHTTGDYVCFIGDDDGIVCNIVDCANWMKANNIEALISVKSVYVWPNEKDSSGFLTIEPSSSLIEYLNPILELRKTLNNGCQELGDIPVVYTGIVSRYILSKVYKDCGTYFPGGASADIANGVALCFYVKRFVKINMPVIITGTSPMTGGIKNRKSFIPFSNIPFISKDVGNNWEGYFPKYWFGCFVWPESAVKSLRALGKESFIAELNIYVVYAGAVIRARVSPWFYKDFCGVTKLSLYVFLRCVIRLYKAFRKRVVWLLLFSFYGMRYNQKNIEDIIEAEKRFRKFSRSFSNIIYK